MGRPSLPHDTQEKIRQAKESGGTIRGIARDLGLSRPSVERVLFPDRVRRREKKKKYSGRLIRLDKSELPVGYFDVYRKGKEDWLTG